ncbi:UDP-N-acetylmuramate dehydrogenase [Natronoglycomyces albus]|uniref:UDP-N-acetylenolpyruvoylglucosamine reductase n=1 Tax=Natronoglycomyces albus TaxID=2811108 RepID=A0A895XXI3_9ACTN|nr:UDP-N-acetylmuramate dehydrogenase [Natronoglycomyces albus]
MASQIGDNIPNRIEETDVNLAEYATLRLGGPAKRLITVTTSHDAITALRSASEAGERPFVLAGGSNVIISDAGWPSTVILLRNQGVTVLDSSAEYVTVRVAAGHNWDAFVQWAISEGLSGVECLSGIPGSAGATPIQNVGAYGQQTCDTLLSATVYDRMSRRVVEYDQAACRFGYRTSVFKRNDRYLVTDVTFRLYRSPNSQPIRYAETARKLGVDVGDTVPLAEARASVLDSRRSKGMVLDDADPDTYSVGSFFVNPVITSDEFEALQKRVATEPPHWPADGDIKVSAAWLIGQAGFEKGYRRGNVGISTKHTLALTNRGGGTTSELMALAEEVATGVEEKLGIRLHPEPVTVGF